MSKRLHSNNDGQITHHNKKQSTDNKLQESSRVN